jgi:hypothetical protein
LPVEGFAQLRLTSASNVRLRQQPSADAAIVAEVPLGTELHEAARPQADASWVRVRVPSDGQEGWVMASLTLPFSENARTRVAEDIIRMRLARKGDGFPAQAQLLDFVEREAGSISEPEAAGRFALYRLEALRGAAAAIPSLRRVRTRQITEWVAARKPSIIYNEPGGSWMVSHGEIIAQHDRHRATAASDEIAWFAATNGLGGECEGYPACYLDRDNRLDGEYLRRHPQGRHAAEAVDRLIARTTSDFIKKQLATPPYLNRDADCAELKTTLASLRSAAAGTRAPARDTLIAALDELDRTCN